MRGSMRLVNSAMLGRSCRRAGLAALTLIPIGFLAIQASALPAGCDPSRPGVTHGADASNPAAAAVVPCLTYALHGFGEANVVVSSNGTVMYGGAYIPEPQEVIRAAYEISQHPVRSENLGESWEILIRPPGYPLGPGPFPPPGPPPGNPPTHGGGDPRVHRDPLTDRIFYHNIGSSYGFPQFPNPAAFLGLCRTEISYTDDGGMTWTDNVTTMNYPQGYACDQAVPALSAFDFPHLFTAPVPPGGDPVTGPYPNVVYVCNRSFVLGNVCWKSLDSLETLIELPGAGAHLTGGPQGTGGLDGTIYNVTGDALHYSTDEGSTWTVATGVVPIPRSRSAVDSAGNVYVIGISAGTPQVTYTTDMGATWSTPVSVQMPGVKHAHDPVIAVPPTGAPGPVAVAYVGSGAEEDTEFTEFPNASNFSDANVRADGLHNGYMATTDNIFAANPVFQSVQVDSNAEPLLPYGYPVTGNTTTTSRADYIGVYIDEAGAEQISEILKFFDQAVTDGDLVGSGPGNSAANRLNALRNMLQTASGQIGGGTPWGYFYRDVCGEQTGVVGQDPAVCDCPIEGVCEEPNPHPNFTNWLGAVATVDRGECGQLRSARNRTDGDPMPPDFVTGDAASDLKDQLEALIERQCG